MKFSQYGASLLQSALDWQLSPRPSGGFLQNLSPSASPQRHLLGQSSLFAQPFVVQYDGVSLTAQYGLGSVQAWSGLHSLPIRLPSTSSHALSSLGRAKPSLHMHLVPSEVSFDPHFLQP